MKSSVLSDDLSGFFRSTNITTKSDLTLNITASKVLSEINLRALCRKFGARDVALKFNWKFKGRVQAAIKEVNARNKFYLGSI